ncbi:Protein S-acyltransferase [Handroanthus impetiginosus]|uniref:Protein S-acyltransferase n=1 Tax=Handroanthus impetiginosus TaxID=429701 RepID=A0A2G9HH04_9LAMI|nr:Protein S-acyltransferase [Handroanthus impetiginosus]
MTSYAALYIWPHLDHRPVSKLSEFVNAELIFGVLKDNILAFLRSAVFLPARGVVLVYLFIASVSVGIGLSVLLWQQLSYIYAGKTYLSHLSAADNDHMVERDCQNLVKFFGCRFSASVYLPSYWKSRKSHEK